MASIGAYTVKILRGKLDALGVRLAGWERPGVDGHYYVDLGTRSNPSSIITVQTFVSDANATTAMANYKALQGAEVSFTDELGNVWPHVVVLDVQILDTPEMPLVVDVIESYAGAATLVYARWLLQEAAP